MLNWLKVVGSAKGRSQARAAGQDRMEQLEPRVLMDGAVINRYDEGVVNWHGFEIEAIRNSWIVTFENDMPREQAISRAQQVANFMGLTVDGIETTISGQFANIYTRTMPSEEAAATAVSHFNFLRQFEPNIISRTTLVPNDARFDEQWAHQNTGQVEVDSGTGNPEPGVIGADMSTPLAWNITTGSDRVVIAVLDTGIDIEHPDLRSNIWTNPLEIPGNMVDDDGNGFVDDVNGWDFASNDPAGQDNNPDDPATQGHGTAVAGCVGAVGGNGIGVTGIMWNCSILPLKIFPNQGGAGLFSILGAYDYMTMLRRNYGVNIVVSNHSYGALVPNDFDSFDDAQEVAIQESTDAGILFVASAGNSSSDNDSVTGNYPATYSNPDIISVAATNNRDALASFSAWGATTVDVGAPGEQILTTAINGGYQRINGTSFSGPYTAGVIGLMAAANRFATNQELKAALLAGVDVVPGLVGRVVSNGRVNAFRSLQLVQVAGPIVAAIAPGSQTPPVSTITVQFDRPIDPQHLFPGGVLDSSKIILRAANLDARFDGNDIFLPVNDGFASLADNILTITIQTGLLPRDLYRLTLVDDGFRDFSGNLLNGDVFDGNNEVYDFNVVSFRGPLEPNDTISTASPLILDAGGRAVLTDLFIGDGLNENVDVDIFRVFVTGPSLISAEVDAKNLPTPSELDAYLRLFDASGVQLAANDNFNGLDSKVQVFVPSAGQYFIGISAYPNRNYNPILAPTGIPGDTTGLFNIIVQVNTAETEDVSFTNSTPIAIPSSGTISSTINVTDGRSIADIDVRVNVLHSYVSDLRITLTGPSGQVVTLVDRRGGAGNQGFQGTIFDRETATFITAGGSPFTGRFRPEGDLATFYDTNAAGTWRLTIADLRAGDSGTLVNWGLDLTLVNDVFGPFEVNDTLLVATDSGINGSGSQTFTAAIGDGAFGLRDVDIFRVFAGAGTTIGGVATPGGGALDTIVRIFDSLGNQLSVDRRKGSTTSSTSFIVVNAGVYYVAVSGGNTTDPLNFGNDAYNPTLGGSGSPTDATGSYTLTISVSGGISESAGTLVGNHLAVGVNTDGTLGIPAGGGSASRGIALDGAEFLLGDTALESFFGLTFDGFIVRNAGPDVQTDLGASLATESDFSNRRMLVTGEFRDLQIRRAISFGVNDNFIAVDVTLRNTSLLPINDVAWLEGFNPGLGDVVDDGRETLNNVQNATGRLATATLQTGQTIGIGAPLVGGIDVFMSFENPGSVRDAFQVINSPNDPDSAGDIGSFGDLTLSAAFNIGSIDGNASVTFRYFIFTGVSQGEVLALFADMDAGTGSGHLVKTPHNGSIASADLPYAIYYPEGFASGRASTFVPIINGNDEGARVVVIARYEGSSAPDVLFDSAVDKPTGLIVANKRDGITITTPDLFTAGTSTRVASTIAGRAGVRKNTPYALEIRSSLPVGATLSHYDFDISTGEAFTSTLDTSWVFGEGNKGSNVQDAVVFYNPSPNTIKVTLTVYTGSGGGGIVTSERTVAGFKRGGWLLGDIPQIANGTVGIKVEGEGPILAALTHFDTNTGSGFATLGVPGTGSTRGTSPEGGVGVRASQEFVSILNAQTTAANVSLTFSFANGSAYRRQLIVQPQRRTRLNVGTLPGFPLGQAYSVSYESNVGVAVNLPSFGLGEATGSVLSASAYTQWLFSEGFRSVSAPNNVTDYLRLFNPTAAPATVAITMNYNNGETETFLRTLPARAATEIDIHELVTGARRTVPTAPGLNASIYGLKIQAAIPIVAYMGHFDNVLGGGFGTLGTPIGAVGLPV